MHTVQTFVCRWPSKLRSCFLVEVCCSKTGVLSFICIRAMTYLNYCSFSSSVMYLFPFLPTTILHRGPLRWVDNVL